jgi:hypothetical protein
MILTGWSSALSEKIYHATLSPLQALNPGIFPYMNPVETFKAESLYDRNKG